MPQMAPISWLTMFIMFSMTLIMFNTMNYYSYLPNSPKSSQQKKTVNIKSVNWKW